MGHRGVVTGGYDEWAAARIPALLRFAHLLTGDAETAEALVRRALERIGSGWSQVARSDDPDRAARSCVVALCPGRPAPVPVPVGGESHDRGTSLRTAIAALPVRRRATLVLRYAEGRTDTEIGDVLGCSARVVHGHLARGHDALREQLAQDGSGAAQREVEDALRETLSGWADQAPTSLRRGIPVIEATPPRRRGALLAALAVVALLGTITVVDRATSTPAGVISYPHTSVPATWRAESYGGVEVEVPETWGWGGAPFRSDLFAHRLGACGADQAAVQSDADHASYISQATGFVGRPVQMSDLCVAWGADGVFPSGNALWFASPMPVGVEAVRTGTVAETRAIGDQHVTVFSHSSALRRQVLGTAHTVGVDANGCPSTGVQRPTPGRATVGSAEPTSMSVCVYSQDSGATALEWSGQVGAAAARAYVEAVGAAAGTHAGACGTTPTGQWVALGVHQRSDVRWDVVDIGCGQIRGDDAEVSLAASVVRPWAIPGVRAYVSAGPSVPADLRRFFHVLAG